MAISIRSETSGSANGNASNQITITKPSSVSNNDYLVAIVGSGNDTSALAPPADWTTAMTHGSATGNDRSMLVAFKLITNAAGEPSTYTFACASADNAAWWIGALSGVSPTTPEDEDMSDNYNDQSNATTITALSITTTSASAFVLAAWTTNYITNAVMPGGSWATRINNKTNTTVDLNVASQIFSASGATGDVSVTTATTGQESTSGQYAFKMYIAPALLTTACPIQLQTSGSLALTYHAPPTLLTTACPIQLQTSASVALTQHNKLTTACPVMLDSPDNVILTVHNPQYTLTAGCPVQTQIAGSALLTAHIPNWKLTSACPVQIQQPDNVTLTGHIPNWQLTTACPVQLHLADNVVLTSGEEVIAQSYMLTLMAT